MNRPLVVLTVCYLAGILGNGLINIKSSVALGAAGLCLLAAAAGYLVAWRENRRVILILFFCLGLAMSSLAAEESTTPLVDYAGRQVNLTGRIIAEPDVRPDKVFYLLETQELLCGTERRTINGMVRLQVKEANQVFGYGDVVRATGLLGRPELPGNPGMFNYRTYLERQGVRVIMTARGEQPVVKVGDSAANPLLAAALQLKQKLSAAAAVSLAPAQAAVLNGIVFGTQGPIDRQTREAFAETGIVHILSVSGLHIGLVVGGMLGLLQLLRLPPGLTVPLLTPVLLFYVLMTGCTPAVLRAAVMALFLLWAHRLGRDRDWPTTLALAALVILLWRPLFIYHPGFQLSFAATWGILYLTPVLQHACGRLFQFLPESLARPVGLALAVPLAAQLATIPLVAWYYNLISPVSILANLVAVPIVGVIMLLGVIAAISGILWLPLAVLINISNGAIIDLFLHIVFFFQGLPGAVFYLPTPPEVLAAAWYGGLIACGWLYSGGLRPADQERAKGWVLTGLVLGGVLFFLWLPWTGGRELTVHFLDVGQGDSILVQTPGGKNMLIDTGGWRGEFQTGTGAGEQVVTPYLRKIGVRRLDVLVLTHPHEDHAGGAAAVVKNFPVRLAVVPHLAGAAPERRTDAPAGTLTEKRGESDSGAEISLAYITLLEQMAAAGVTLRTAGSGDILKLDRETQVAVLSPGADLNESDSNLNDCSLVLKLTYRERAFLFTGDVEIEAQGRLIREGADLNADVLKMPHHGSGALLPALVAQVAPEAAVISVGANNQFGHPARSTLNILSRAGITVYRTDLDGAVIFTTDGRRLEVCTGKNKNAA